MFSQLLAGHYTTSVKRAAILLALAFAATARAQHPQLAITFDDLPAHGPLEPGQPRPAVVKSILATLTAEHLPPTYGFVNGFRIARFPYQVEILRAWRDAGNPLGNHTWSHPELDKRTAAQYEANIARNEATLQNVAPNEDWRWFRFPYLEEGNTVAKREAVRGWLFAHHYRIAEVSIDFQDWAWDDTYGRCAAQHNTAAIERLHDTYLEAAAKADTAFRQLAHTLYGHDIPYVLLMHLGSFDARMLPELLAQYRAEGFQFIPMPEALADPAYAQDPRQPTPGGSTFLEQIAVARHITVPDLPDYMPELDKLCR
jgi:peptidoglycan/xylan/chitin deacetylase (PgdA/CDA1 family)